MIGLIKNEWLKLLNNKKFYWFLLLLLIIYLFPVLMTLVVRMNTLNGQVYPLTVFGVITSFVMPLFLIVLIAEIVTEDYLSGNLSHTIIQPVTRWQIITAKVLFVFLLLITLMLFCLLLGYGIGCFIFGWGTDFMLRGASYTSLTGVKLTIISYLSASLPLLAFGLFVTFIAVIVQSGAAAVGISAGILFFSIMLELLTEIGPFLINNYFNTLPFILGAFVNPMTLISSIVFISCFGLLFYFLTLVIFIRKDMVL
ncbi:MAG: ABC transporter permease subunit [Firmicutes bacterium]|nr:ABC transporter permease subunit [Bacillota bacterium]